MIIMNPRRRIIMRKFTYFKATSYSFLPPREREIREKRERERERKRREEIKKKREMGKKK